MLWGEGLENVLFNCPTPPLFLPTFSFSPFPAPRSPSRFHTPNSLPAWSSHKVIPDEGRWYQFQIGGVSKSRGGNTTRSCGGSLS